ncbi:uncharacterized protein METZ01_LOCUS173347 [marine metagenome]|uniref:Uncharacterized protein n=1 Tax=marine metagenome TaxID=408172 RepID=A0A382C5B8_9ZZZZ
MLKRRKNQQWDWTDKTDSAIERYIKWESKPHIQQRIYKEHIEIPLKNTSRRNIKNVMYFNKGEKLMEFDPYKESTYETEINNLVIECESFFFTTLLPYIKNGNIKTIFGYVNSSIKHYLVSLNIDKTMNEIGGSNFVPLPLSDEEYSVMHRKGHELEQVDHIFNDEVDYINLMMNYWDKKIEYIWNRSNQELQRQIAHNVIELFRRKNQIKHFKVDSMRRYLRKMMNWDSGTNIYNVKGGGSKRNVFNRVIRFMRDRNKLLRFQYNKRGMIDFYYI